VLRQQRMYNPTIQHDKVNIAFFYFYVYLPRRIKCVVFLYLGHLYNGNHQTTTPFAYSLRKFFPAPRQKTGRMSNRLFFFLLIWSQIFRKLEKVIGADKI
jgi:hypothetical protein